MTRVAIVQSNYIPWKGYFDMIASVDAFVLLDDVQYTRRDWRNRNRIKTPAGTRWLTIPVRVASRSQRIRDTRVSDPAWRRKHWRALHRSYARAPCFAALRRTFEPLYLDAEETALSLINRAFIEAACACLDIATPLHWSREFELADDATDRLVGICRQLGADTYLSGPAARDYLDETRFRAEGMSVEWMCYDGYPEYPQVHPPFDHWVSILDLLFHCGDESRHFMLGAQTHGT